MNGDNFHHAAGCDQKHHETVSCGPSDAVDHPKHYGGDTPYEVINVLKAWDLLNNFCLANTIKYIARAGLKGALLQDLKKARWYLDYEIKRREEQ